MQRDEQVHGAGIATARRQYHRRRCGEWERDSEGTARARGEGGGGVRRGRERVSRENKKRVAVNTVVRFMA